MLCDEIHTLRVHAILIRKIRTDEEINTDIFIFSIYCIRAKKRGWQYTKRILPPFVIPECNIMLVNVWDYIVGYPNDVIHYEEAGIILGTLDNRTIRRHIQLVWQMIGDTNVGLMGFLATLPGYAVLPELKPGGTAYSHLGLLVEQLNCAAVRMGEACGEAAARVNYIHGMYVLKKSRSWLKPTSNLVFHTLLFFDTS